MCTWCSGWWWYPAFLHWAIVAPWNITSVKYASNSRILSAAMDATSRGIGSGCELNVKETSQGWIITIEFETFSRFNIIRKYAVSSGLLLKTYKRRSQTVLKDRYNNLSLLWAVKAECTWTNWERRKWNTDLGKFDNWEGRLNEEALPFWYSPNREHRFTKALSAHRWGLNSGCEIRSKWSSRYSAYYNNLATNKYLSLHFERNKSCHNYSSCFLVKSIC